MPYVATNGKSHSLVCQADRYLTTRACAFRFPVFNQLRLKTMRTTQSPITVHFFNYYPVLFGLLYPPFLYRHRYSSFIMVKFFHSVYRPPLNYFTAKLSPPCNPPRPGLSVTAENLPPAECIFVSALSLCLPSASCLQ